MKRHPVSLRKALATVGVAVTTFLIAGAVTIEVLTALVGGEIGPGIIGVFVGTVTGIAAGGAVLAFWTRLRAAVRRALLAYGAFGLTIVGLAALSYVNAPLVDEILGFAARLIVAAVVAAIVFLLSWRSDRIESSA